MATALFFEVSVGQLLRERRVGGGGGGGGVRDHNANLLLGFWAGS